MANKIGVPGEKFCPFCGKTVKSIAKKCKHCKEILDSGQSPVSETKLCMVCGEEVKFIAKKCKHCGENLQPLASVHKNKKRSSPLAKDKTFNLIWGVITAIVAILAIMGTGKSKIIMPVIVVSVILKIAVELIHESMTKTR